MISRRTQGTLELAEKHTPDVILLDLEMPVLDGLETARPSDENPGDVRPFSSLTATIGQGPSPLPRGRHGRMPHKALHSKDILGEIARGSGGR